MNATTKPRILIAGRNGSSNLCMARSFGRAGYQVEVLRIYQSKPKFTNLMRFLKPEKYSRYVSSWHSCICGGDSALIADTLIALARSGEKMLLIPACDLAASAADEYMQVLQAYYLLPGVKGQPGELSRLMDKALQTRLAEQAGLPVVPSCVIKTENGRFTVPEAVHYPCFIKPNVSKDSDKTKIRRCDTKQELEAALTGYSRRKDVEMLVEDFVDIRQEYALLGLSTREGAMAPGFFALEQGGHEDRRGVTMVGRILPCEGQKELIHRITKFVHGLGYEGLFDVDLMEDHRGNWYFVELNLRYGASGYAVTQSGVNLPGMYADHMLQGKPIDWNCRVEAPGKRFVSEKILLDEYARGFLTMRQVRKLADGADIHFIRDAEDPAPYRHFRRFFLFGGVTRLLFRLKRALK